MSRKVNYNKKNITTKNKSSIKGGSIFTNFQNMITSTRNSNQKYTEINKIQSELKDNLKAIDNSIKTFKETYIQLVNKYEYLNSQIEHVVNINDKCKVLHPEINTSTEPTESKGFMSYLFGSKTEDKPTEEHTHAT